MDGSNGQQALVDIDSASGDDFMQLLLGGDNFEDDGRAQFNSLPIKPLEFQSHDDESQVQFRSVDVSTRSLFGDSTLSVNHGHCKPDALAWQADSKEKALPEWMVGTEPEPTFATPKLQPFYQEDTVTQFESSKPSEVIFKGLVGALQHSRCMYDVDRAAGTIKLLSFVDHSRIKATLRVYSKAHGKHLVHYSRTFGDRVPATRLFFTIANASGLIKLQLPRLLQPAPTPSPLEHDDEASAPAASVTLVFVDMLQSSFIEECLVGAQGLARACSSPATAALYAEHLPDIIAAYEQHVNAPSAEHAASQDVAACLAEVIGRVGAAAARTNSSPAIQPMLESASKPDADAVCASASLEAVGELCRSNETLRAQVLSKHRTLVDAATQGPGPCSTTGPAPDFVKDVARTLRTILSL